MKKWRPATLRMPYRAFANGAVILALSCSPMDQRSKILIKMRGRDGQEIVRNITDVVSDDSSISFGEIAEAASAPASQLSLIFSGIPTDAARVQLAGDIAEPIELMKSEEDGDIAVILMVPRNKIVEEELEFLNTEGAVIGRFMFRTQVDTFIATYRGLSLSNSINPLHDFGRVLEFGPNEPLKITLQDRYAERQWLDRLRLTQRLHFVNQGPKDSFRVEMPEGFSMMFYQGNRLRLLSSDPLLLKEGEKIGLYPFADSGTSTEIEVLVIGSED